MLVAVEDSELWMFVDQWFIGVWGAMWLGFFWNQRRLGRLNQDAGPAGRSKVFPKKLLLLVVTVSGLDYFMVLTLNRTSPALWGSPTLTSLNL
jgi:uncharacterized membrane protein